MFGKALIIALAAFAGTYIFRDGINKIDTKMLIAGIIIVALFVLYVVGIFL